MFRNSIVGAALLGLATPALAATATYTDRGTFLAAAGPVGTETFNSYADDVPIGNNTAVDVGAFSLSGSLTGSNPRIDVLPTFYPQIGGDGTTFVLAELGSSQTLLLTFDHAISAFGVDLDGFNDTFGVSDIYLNGVALGVPVSAGTAQRFFGFTSTMSFNTVELRGTADRFGLDNVVFGAAPVPEPGEWAMIGIGIALVGRTARRRRNATQS